VPAHWESAIGSPGIDVICHGDLAAAQSFTLNHPNMAPEHAAERLATFAAGYGADEALRAALPSAMLERVTAKYELLRSSHATGVQPWAAMYLNCHGAHWRAALEYVKRHKGLWNHALTADRPGQIQ
jgi:hypothetical protein